MIEESRETGGGVIAGMLRSLEDGHSGSIPSIEPEEVVMAASPEKGNCDEVLEGGQGAEPEDCTQLSDVFRLVQIKGDKAPQKGRVIKGCHSITFTAPVSYTHLDVYKRQPVFLSQRIRCPHKHGW